MERRYSYDEGMVLRTVYLPKDLDENLRKLAYEARKSKNEIIRNLIVKALETYGEAQEEGEVVSEKGTAKTETYARAAVAAR